MIQYKQNNKSLIETGKSNKDYSIKHFHEASRKHFLICRTDKIVIPKVFQN